jgi:hypothetical protein
MFIAGKAHRKRGLKNLKTEKKTYIVNCGNTLNQKLT